MRAAVNIAGRRYGQLDDDLALQRGVIAQCASRVHRIDGPLVLGEHKAISSALREALPLAPRTGGRLTRGARDWDPSPASCRCAAMSLSRGESAAGGGADAAAGTHPALELMMLRVTG